MYKFAVILVLLAGTACAFPPNNIWEESVAEDAVDEKAPEVSPQGSEVESQKEGATRKSDDELTPIIALLRTKTQSPTSSDRSTEESEEPKKLCEEDAAGCDLLGELASRRKRTIETLPLDQPLNIPIESLGIIDFSNIEIPNFSIDNAEASNHVQINLQDFSQLDMNKLLENGIIVNDGSHIGEIKITNDSPVEIRSDDWIAISLGEVKVPIDMPGDNSGSETSANEVKKLQEENEVMKKKLEKAEEDLAQQTKKYNEEKNRVEENWKKVLEETREKEDQERKTLQEKHDAEIESLKASLTTANQFSVNLAAKLNQQTTNCDKNLKAEKERCKNQHTGRTTQAEKRLAQLENSYNDIIKQKEIDIQNLLNSCKQRNRS
ncbi:uncharacterized protein LOC124406326 [Diprion similis]|uniref:uncharacterized protein LOC124406326 n=1 Tax=Diprion similis TaxID=362088 RepID=UPI001EF84F68|nr:uncharacterized protein LOC124406326 [Diprion similis]